MFYKKELMSCGITIARFFSPKEVKGARGVSQALKEAPPVMF